jgi:hypothetical protein
VDDKSYRQKFYKILDAHQEEIEVGKSPVMREFRKMATGFDDWDDVQR